MSTPAPACAQHPAAAAVFRCDGCERPLCAECVTESHALFLCRVCGERALPLSADRAATVRERRREEAIARPYALGEAFGYAFRGLGKFLFLATLVSMAFIEFIVRFGFGCLPLFFALAFWALLVGLQFKIVRTSADGDNELPDWPEYFDWGERLREVLVYLWISFLQFAPLVAYLVVFGGDGLAREAPSFLFWIGFAVVGWLGAGLALFGFAAAALAGGGAALRIDRHLSGFFAAGGEAVTMTNLVFLLGVGVFVARSVLAVVPLAGAAIAGTLGAYWLFTSAHLVGVLVRRRRVLFRELYG